MTTWIESIDKDILPLVADFAPRKYKSLNPFILCKQLDQFNEERWTRVLKSYRIGLSFGDSTYAEYDDEADKIYITAQNNISKFELIQTILHEMVHVNQFHSSPELYDRPTGKSESDDAEYYSCFGEVQAFAHCIFIETQDIGSILTPTIQRYHEFSYSTKRSLLTQVRRWESRYLKYGIKLNHCLFSPLSSTASQLYQF